MKQGSECFTVKMMQQGKMKAVVILQATGDCAAKEMFRSSQIVRADGCAMCTIQDSLQGFMPKELEEWSY